MKNLLLGVLSLILLGALTYFCFENKSETIKQTLLQQANSHYQAEGMHWVKTNLSGQDLEMKRIMILEGTAPSQELKEKAEEIARNLQGIAGIKSNLTLLHSTRKITTQDISKKKMPSTIKPLLYELNISKDDKGMIMMTGYVPDKGTIENSTNQTKISKTSISCQKSLTRVMKHNKIHFNYKKTTINKNSYKLMNKIITITKECPSAKIIIGGHTDSIGSYGYNKILSQKRANSVKRYMVKKGINTDRLQAIGYGERKPITSNMEKAGRAKNRRIEFTIKGVTQ